MDRKKFKRAMILKNKNVVDVARELGRSPAHVYNCIRNDRFTIAEVKAMVKFLDIDDPVAVFLTDEKAE